MKGYRYLFICVGLASLSGIFCNKKNDTSNPPVSPGPASFAFNSLTVNSVFDGFTYYNVNARPVIKISFSADINPNSIANSFTLKDNAGSSAAFTSSVENDSIVVIQPVNLTSITKYGLSVSTQLMSTSGGNLQSGLTVTLITAMDSTDKFTTVSDSALLTLVEQQTFKYFYDFGHPVSGLARERNTSGDVVTTGGSGFGVMAILVGIQRNFLTRAEGLSRLDTIVNFLTNKAQKYHGAFPHWMNGATGETVPFSNDDNGADLVETSYLMQGLLSARQYFNAGSAEEINLRNGINNLWAAVEWNWFRQNGQNVLYWHWSPNLGFKINMPIRGWNEAMIVYALLASSPVDSNRIPKTVYDEGWAQDGAMQNGNVYYGLTLPLGPSFGGPLFFSHYSFLGINPHDLTDAYAGYWIQNQNHSLINYNYCVSNPKKYNGYSNAVWGLTASDDNQKGYDAHSPTNDDGVVTPTAAISSIVYTPVESMQALRFFYYKLGDKIWGEYGFTDAFNLRDLWFANSYLAIDQGPQIIMIENYRSGLLWDLFMSCPEIKTGMKNLNFQSPQLN